MARLALLLVLLSISPLARGEAIRGTAVLAVAGDSSGQSSAAMMQALLETGVLGRRGLRLIDPARALSGDPRTREEETLDRARAALTDGRAAYDALKLDDAIARLGQSVNLYQQTGPLLGDLLELVTTLTYLGSALVLRGSSDEAESTFVELLTMRPNHQLEGFPPAVNRTFDRAVDRVESTPSGSVEIYSTPPFGAVFVDGRFEGVTPVTLTDLTAGTHYVRIAKTGYTVYGAPLELAPNQRVSSQTRLSSIKRGAELRDLAARASVEVSADGMGGALRELARQLAADSLVLVSVTQSGNDATLTAGIFDVASGTRLATERAVLSIGEAGSARRFADRLLAFADGSGAAAETSALGGSSASGGSTAGAFGLGNAAGTAASDRTAPYAVAPLDRGTPSEVYLGWTMIGLGGASIITGVVFAILAKGAHTDFRSTSQASPDLPALRDVGKTDALVADLCFLGGGLAAMGGSTILLLTRSTSPTPAELLSLPRASLAPLEGGGVFTIGGAF